MSRTSRRRRSPSVRPRTLLRVEQLEQRLNPAPTPHQLVIDLIPEIDQFGDQIITMQAYASPGQPLDQVNRVTFAIFDTGASALTFGAEDLGNMPEPVPIKVLGGALAEGIGGFITGDVSEPGDIIADGLDAADLTFDEYGFPLFDIHYTGLSGRTPGIQAFLGTEDGSPILPSITGTPLLNPSASNPHGLAAYVEMLGHQMDFTDLFGDPNNPEDRFYIALPGIRFVDPTAFTHTVPADTAYDPVTIPLIWTGFNTYAEPGDLITETHSPVIPGTELAEGAAVLGGQNFLFDTGAQLSIISTAQAAALGFVLDDPANPPPFTIEVQGAAGTAIIPGFLLDALTIPRTDGGTISFRNVPVFVLDIGYDIDGIFGMNLLNMAHSFLYTYDPASESGTTLSLSYFVERDTTGLDDLLDGGGLDGGLLQNLMAGQGFDPAQFEQRLQNDPLLSQFLGDLGAGSLGNITSLDQLFSTTDFAAMLHDLEQLFRDLGLLGDGESFTLDEFLGFLGADLDTSFRDLNALLGQLDAGLGKSLNWMTAPQMAALNTLTGQRLPSFDPATPPAAPATLGGRVLLDADSSGTVSAGDTGLSGRTVYLDLSGDGSLQSPGEPSTTTGADGSYQFTGLEAGTYQVRLVASGTEQLLASPAALTLTAGQTVATADFLTREPPPPPPPAPATLGGRVLLDADSSGTVSAGDTGLSGRTVYLDLSGDGSLQSPAEPSMTTGADGSYQFTGLAAGSYQARLVPVGTEVVLIAPAALTLAAGQTVATADFLTREPPPPPPPAPATLGGRVLLDADSSGTVSAGDTGLSGRTVYLDLSGDGSLQSPAEPSMTTGADGSYQFTGLAAGSYQAQLVPAGTEELLIAPAALTLTAGQTVATADFLTREPPPPPPPAPATLGGRVLLDADSSGTVSAADTGLSGRTVFLDLSGDGSLQSPDEPSTTTGADGSYQFPGLAAGSYQARLVLAGTEQLLISPNALTLTAGQTVSDAHFLTHVPTPPPPPPPPPPLPTTGTLGGRLMLDTDGSRTVSPGDTPLVGYRIFLDGNGSGAWESWETSVITAADGSYAFPNLAAGAYLVAASVPPGLSVVAAPGAVAVAAGATVTSAHFLAVPDDPSTKFVKESYLTILGRAAEPDGLAWWTAALNNGLSRADLVREFRKSQEFRALMVRNEFLTLLGREPDDAGLAYFTARLAAGGTLEQVRADIMASPEFLAPGASDGVFLANLYRHALGRDIEPEGLAHYTSVLTAGTPRPAVVAAVVESTEGRANWVRQLYQRILHRDPDPAGLAYWVGRLAQGMPREQVWQEFTGSPEFLSF